MNYTIARFNKDYPNDDVCLETILYFRYGELNTCPHCGVIGTKYYKVKDRKCFECKECGHQIYPLAGTIFHKSDTPLTKWFFAIYLFANSKNGVSAKELERHLGVTYKCAWRIAKQIRRLMQQNHDKLTGIVEADETYIGGRSNNENRFLNKTAIVGIAQRKGQARAIVADADATTAIPYLRSNITSSTTVFTDESRIYSRVKREFRHEFVNHSKKEFGRGNVNTNTIEGFWSQLKRSLHGTYHAVSPKYLQLYVNEFVFRYNYREISCYPLLLELAAKQVV
jgi:transposase